MPQFDKITFFNQIFWLFFFFSGFYFIFLKIFLPKLSSVLKARTKKLQKGSSGVASFSKEQDLATVSFNSLIEQMSSVVKFSVQSSSEKMTVWTDSAVKSLNKENLNASNSVVEKLVHKQIVTTHLLSTINK
jgi:F0F1-type ATP synthase membrane subunit b/b'